MADHTPLPWRKGFGRTASEKYIDIYGIDNREIARLPVTDDNRALQDANAALIVAAPAMLQALRQIANATDVSAVHMDAVLLAIAKAEAA